MLERLRAFAPQDAGVLLDLAEFAGRQGQAAEAAEYLVQAKKYTSDSSHFHRIGLIYGELGENQRCVDILKTLTARHPGTAVYFSDLGICAYLSGAVDDAVKDLAMAIQLDAGFMPAYISMGAIHTMRQEYAEALQIYDRALAQKAHANYRGLRDDILKARADVVVKAGKVEP
ncbi:MAG: hypothetical protein HZB91_11665 [Elusimicrobia bacterium]|nr:hypothetical protein [Elusimicrobiota bacterium]